MGLHICSDLPLRGVGQPPARRHGAGSSRPHVPVALALGMAGQVGHLQPVCAGSAQDGHTIGRHQAPGGGVVGARQVVEVPPVLVLAAPCHLLILLAPHYLALVGDGLHVVLILVAGLVQRVLLGKGGEERSASGLALASGPHPTQDPPFWISS